MGAGMILRHRVFVRELPSGAFLAIALSAEVAAAGDTRESALEAVRAALAAHHAGEGRGEVAGHVHHERQDLVPLAVDLQPAASRETLPVTISLVVTQVAGSRDTRVLVVAPMVPGFEVSVADRRDVEGKARKALQRYARGWPAEAILNADERGWAGLETVEVEVGAPGPGVAEADEADVLGLCGVSLSARAAAGALGGADRRDDVVDALLAALVAEGPRSAVLVGPADVGKTAIVHEAVTRMLAVEDAPEAWSITAGALMAGMRMMGDWEERVQRLVAQARARRVVLVMGDPEEILSAGRWSKSDHNVARALRPAVEAGDVVLVVECTPEAYEACVEREPSFMHALRRIDVPEPRPEERAAIVAAAARRIEARAGVRIEQGAVDAALELTRRFVPYRAFPGKAVRLLKEMVRAAPPDGLRAFGREQATAAFARRSGLPEVLLSDAAPLRLADLRAHFEERLLGQPEAVDAVVDLVTVIKAGLNDPAKPLAALFFVGPTGVGKTEMAKVLAEYLFGARDRLVRFDMGEYAGEDALPRLVGTAWQPDGEGELTRRVRAQPFCVLLLDEIEKAHRDVFDVLLAALGEGRVSDANGRTADLRNAIVVMTSNLGAERSVSQGLGFGPAGAEGDESDRLARHYVEQAERFFRPEFFNRLDRIVAFRPLSQEAMRLVARRELGRMLMREGVVRRNLLVEIDDVVIDRLLERGFHPRYGARPLQREIERAVIVPLARLLVEGDDGSGGVVRATLADGEVALRPVAVDRHAPEPPPEPPAPAPDLRPGTVLEWAEAVRLAVEIEREEGDAPVLRDEVSGLLARTRAPGFWDRPEQARATLARVYDLEGLLARLDALSPRAESVQEWARQVRAHHDRRRLPEVGRAVEALGLELAYARVEIAAAVEEGAAGPQDLGARVRVSAVGAGAEAWAEEVRGMYAGWASRRGLEHRSGRAGLEVLAPRAYVLLRGEAGLHRLSGTGGRRPTLARVAILADGSPQASAEVDTVVRVYSRGRHRFVRDPRTGVRVSDVRAVLAGGIDEFLLASPLERELAR